MAAPYIPNKDADFDNWLQNFSTLITATPTAYGLTAPNAVAIAAVTTAWGTAYAASTNPTTRTAATVAAKDNARSTAEATTRPFAIQIRNSAAISDALKIGVGVTVPNVPPTPIPAPAVAPALSLISAISLEQKLAYKDPSQVGKSKPFGSTGVEVWRAIGLTAAVDPAQCTFMGTVTKSPFVQSFDAGNAGKKVTYFARYVTRSGPGGVAQRGPWSDALNLVVM